MTQRQRRPSGGHQGGDGDRKKSNSESSAPALQVLAAAHMAAGWPGIPAALNTVEEATPPARDPRSVSVVRARMGVGRADTQPLGRLARAIYGMPVRVEITGLDARVIDDAMQGVRCQHAEYAWFEAAEQAR